MQPTKLSLAVLLIPLTAVFLSGCGRSPAPSAGDTASATPSGPAPSPKTGFEADLDYVRKGQYAYIWVFSRKDGKPVDKDDAAYLRKNAPQVVDWVSSEEGKRVIAGTNFDLAKG